MSKNAFRRVFALFPFIVGFACPAAAAEDARVNETYGKLPLHFEANRGQTHKDVRFLSRGPGYTLYLTSGEAVLVLTRPNPDEKKRDVRSRRERGAQTPVKSLALRMRLVGAAPEPAVSGLEEQPGTANYFIGKDSAKWLTKVPTYARVHYRDVYPGIDLLYYGNQRQLEYDFVVAPGADPKKIVLGFKGADKLEIDAKGELVLHAAGGDIRQHKPFIYQNIEGIRREIAGGYVRKGANRVSFQVAAYDRSQPLVIDPVLSYSTFLGGSGFNWGGGIAVDADGNAYVVGLTNSSNFPTTAGAFQTIFGGGTGFDAFVTKLNPTGSALVYSTYLGGNGSDSGHKIAVDGAGNAYVVGQTFSSNFPTTAGAFQTSFGGGYGDAFLTKLNPTGSALVYSTYLGGTGEDDGSGISVDADGNAYVAGFTQSADFPATAGAFQKTFGGGYGDAFVTKLDPTGSALIYSTYLGGADSDAAGNPGLAVDASGSAYVTSETVSTDFPITAGAFQATLSGYQNAFVTKLDPTGSALVYSTYLGGSITDWTQAIAVDADGNAYVTGVTTSTDFPTTAGAVQTSFGGGRNDAFVVKLNPAGSALVYSTYLGGSGKEAGSAIAVDTAGNAFVTGRTNSSDFPTTITAFQRSFGGGTREVFGGDLGGDAIVTKLNADGSALVYSTYLGGSENDYGYGIALDAQANPNAYVTGSTSSFWTFPTTAGAFQTGMAGSTDAFVAKISDP
jgi:hypothetical protein